HYHIIIPFVSGPRSTNLSASVICEQMKRNQIRIKRAIHFTQCLPLSLRSRLSRFDSFSEVDKLAGIRLEELAVELGVPLGKGTIDEEPLVPEDDNTGPVLWPSNPGWPEAAATAAAAAAFKEPD